MPSENQNVNVTVLTDAERIRLIEQAIRCGFAYALQQFGIWRDGVQRIGCLETPIKDALVHFDEEGTAYDLAIRFE